MAEVIEFNVMCEKKSYIGTEKNGGLHVRINH
jgi:hypothetical protein